MFPSDKLTIRHTPRASWYAGMAFMGVAALVAAALTKSYLSGALTKARVEDWQMFGMFLIPVGVFLGGVHFLLRPVVTTVIDPLMKKLHIQQKYWFSKKERELKFADLDGQFSLEWVRRRSQKFYMPLIADRNGEIIKLLSDRSPDEVTCRSVMENANAYLNLIHEK